MSLSIIPSGPNSVAPFARAETFVPDQLIAGHLNLITQDILVAAGRLLRGTILGRISAFGATVAAGSSIRKRHCGRDAGVGRKIGAYALVAASDTKFNVTDPSGAALADATVGADYNAGGIAFKISAGTTAFASGDSFTVTVADGVGSFVKSVKTATDGSQNPVAVLVDDVDATAGPRPGSAYFMGEFNARAIIFDPSWALDHLRASLPNGVYLKSSVSAADPT